MKIYITGHKGAAGVMEERPQEFNVILYTNSNYPAPVAIKENAKSLIHFSVDDIDVSTHGKVSPSMLTVINFLDWSRDKEDIMCVCHAGVSRSSATAYVIASSRIGPEKALEFLKPMWHWPNRLIVWLGSQILESPEIWNVFVQWQLEETGLNPELDFDFPEAEF